MSEDQLQPADTLDDRGVEDVLDEGYSPPEKLRGSVAHGTTPFEAATNETIDERLAQEEPEEEPDLSDPEHDPAPPGVVGTDRAGRLVAPDEGSHEDTVNELVATDVGIDGAGASAEEAAIHVIDDEADLA